MNLNTLYPGRTDWLGQYRESAVAVVGAGHPPALRSSTGAVAVSVTWLGPAAAVMLPGVARWRWCGGVAALLRSWREEDNDHH